MRAHRRNLRKIGNQLVVGIFLIEVGGGFEGFFGSFFVDEEKYGEYIPYHVELIKD